jgi:hypothetical protein
VIDIGAFGAYSYATGLSQSGGVIGVSAIGDVTHGLFFTTGTAGGTGSQSWHPS